MLEDDATLARIEADWRGAELDPRRTAMLGYVERLTRTPAAVTREDVEGLRSARFSDADILAIAEVAAYYAYVNRIANGLGVAVEPWLEAAVGGEG